MSELDLIDLIAQLGLNRVADYKGDSLQRRLRSGQLLEVVSAEGGIDVSAPHEVNEKIIAVVWDGYSMTTQITGCTLQTLAAELCSRGYTEFRR
jgi:hypothetical protein